MAQIHSATSSPKAREMVDVVLAEFDRWLPSSQAHGAAIGGNPNEGAKYALYNMREELSDHLVIAVGITLETWGLTGHEETP